MGFLRVPSLVLICSVIAVVGCSCPTGFLDFQESCYWFSDIEATFAEARSYCGFLESHLAVITSREEDDFIRNIARTKTGRHYVGATDLASEGIWKWEGGLDMNTTYTNWLDNEPNNPGERCLDLLPIGDYRWNDAFCHQPRKFVCEQVLTTAH